MKTIFRKVENDEKENKSTDLHTDLPDNDSIRHRNCGSCGSWSKWIQRRR